MNDYRAPLVAPPPAPPPLRAMLFPLSIVVDGVDVVVRKSQRMYVVRGLLALFALPVLFGLLAVLIGLGFLEDDTGLDVLSVLWFGLAGLSVVFGLGMLLLSGALSRRGEVRFDRTRGVVVAGAVTQPFTGLELRVRERGGLNNWRALELHRQGVVVVTLYDRLQSIHAREIAQAGDYVAQLLGADPPAVAPGGPLALPTDDRTAAMLCYLPLQGINLMASLWFLFQAKDKPFVRFAARQSLVQLGVAAASLASVCILFGVPLAISASGERELSPASIALLILTMLGVAVIAIVNLAACVTAAVRAYRGQAWVMPWLRRIVTRWLPPA